MNTTIESTQNTPEVFYNDNVNLNISYLTIRGKSLPEDAIGFYNRVQSLISDVQHLLIITLRFEYLNSSSEKALYNVLRHAIVTISNVEIRWEYEEDDEDMEETGHVLEECLSIKFSLSKRQIIK
jgi:hypothetical protein